MLIPSYAELMDVLNKSREEKDEVTSRYTIVIASSKRARQIIEGDEPMTKGNKDKPLSTAVSELLEEKIKIVPEGEGTVLVFKKDIEENKKNYYRDKEIKIEEFDTEEDEEGDIEEAEMMDFIKSDLIGEELGDDIDFVDIDVQEEELDFNSDM